jgi:SsrA-binding protein
MVWCILQHIYMSKQNIHITNKRASFEYHILGKYTAGIQLLGSEIKSVREGNVNLSDAFCFFKAQAKEATEELYVRNMNIGTFKQASHYNHDTLRVRKLLLTKTELRKLKSKASEKGLTIVPLKMYVSETGYAKLEIAIAQGKKAFDKRESIKERDVKRSLQRED